MLKRSKLFKGILGACAAFLANVVGAGEAQAFDFDTGNAATEIVIPVAVPVILQTVAPGDATIILRMTAMNTNGWYDAIAPYHPTAVGIYSRLGRRPASEHVTHRERNVAMLYASQKILTSLLPRYASVWDGMLSSVGLDPTDNSQDLTTPIGIGNVAGRSIVAARENDGMNQLGNAGGVNYNRRPYADYTGYKPVNTPELLKDPGRWQPNITTTGSGIFKSQVFVTPQLGQVTPFFLEHVKSYKAPVPFASNPKHAQAYRAQVDEVLAASAGLDDQKKLTAELFNHKFFSLSTVALFAGEQAGLDLDELIQLEFLVNMGSFDGAIVTWKEKRRYDAVRPFSAIRYLYGDKNITAWGGPGRGTVSDIKGKEWRSYLDTADHPDYPSGSACFCAIHAQGVRRFLGTDDLNWSVNYEPGSSVVEPGVTPASPITLEFPTWTEFEERCQDSRVWGGVHFRSAVEQGAELCRPIGDEAYEFLQSYIEGNPPAR